MITKERQQTSDRIRRRWLRINELPVSRNVYYKHLRNNPEIVSATIKPPGGTKGVVLIDGDSLDAYLDKLAVQQAGKGRK